MKLAGLRLAAAVSETLPHNDRNTAAVQAEAWKLLEKHIKVVEDRVKERQALADALKE